MTDPNFNDKTKGPLTMAIRKLTAGEMTAERTLYLEIPELSDGDDRAVVVLRRPNAERITNYVRSITTEKKSDDDTSNETSKNDAMYELVAECLWDEDSNAPLLTRDQVKTLDSAVYSRVASVVSGFINTGENTFHPLVSPSKGLSIVSHGTSESLM